MAPAQIEVLVEQQFLALAVQRYEPRLGTLLRYIDQALLANGPYGWFVPKLLAGLDETSAVPAWEYIDIQINRSFGDDPEKLAEVRNTIYLLYTMPITWGEQAIEEFRNYLAWREVSAGFSKAQDGFRRSHRMVLAVDHMRRTLDRATGMLVSHDGSDLVESYDICKADWIRTRENPGLRRRFAIGIEKIDRELHLIEGTVTAVLGVYKDGKSIVLNHFTLCAMAHGFDVAHIVYENPLKMTLDRFFTRLLELDYTDVVNARAEVADPELWERKEQFIRDIQTAVANRVKLYKAKPKITTVADIEAWLDVLRNEEGFIPDVTVWDYANLIGVSRDRREREERLNQETVIWDLQAHAKDEKNGGAREKIVVTAAQARGEAAGKDTLEASDWGKSIGIAQALDALVGIKRTPQNKVDNEAKFSVLINRHGNVVGEDTQKGDFGKMCIANCTVDWLRGKFMDLIARNS